MRMGAGVVFRRIVNRLKQIEAKPEWRTYGGPGFPPEFDAHTYRETNLDLLKFDDDQLFEHYCEFGRLEGRRSYPFLDRRGLANFYSGNGPVLEISPFTAPFFTGDKVKYADVMSRLELVKRATELNLDSDSIPRIDYVVPPSKLSSVIKETFDLVASSHVIEHQPNLLGHLREVGKILRPGGSYVIVVPDKRYCFDHFLAESTIADLLQADMEKRELHTLKSVIEHGALTTHNEPARHWRGDHGSISSQIEKVQTAISEFKNSENKYLDVHAWYFTPDSLVELLSKTFALGMQPFQVGNVYPTYKNNLEFYVVLNTEVKLLTQI
jgi:SAM-dependent methyltransferase